jgi:hypothetical protein
MFILLSLLVYYFLLFSGNMEQKWMRSSQVKYKRIFMRKKASFFLLPTTTHDNWEYGDGNWKSQTHLRHFDLFSALNSSNIEFCSVRDTRLESERRNSTCEIETCSLALEFLVLRKKIRLFIIVGARSSIYQ